MSIARVNKVQFVGRGGTQNYNCVTFLDVNGDAITVALTDRELGAANRKANKVVSLSNRLTILDWLILKLIELRSLVPF